MGKTRAEYKQYGDYTSVAAAESTLTRSTEFPEWRRGKRLLEEQLRETSTGGVRLKPESPYSSNLTRGILPNGVAKGHRPVSGAQSSYMTTLAYPDAACLKTNQRVEDEHSSAQPTRGSSANGYEEDGNSDSTAVESDGTGYTDNDSVLNHPSNSRTTNCTCDIAKEFHEVKQMLLSLQHTVADLRNRFHHDRLLSGNSGETFPRSKYSAYQQPDKSTWDVMQKYTCGNLAVILRKSPGWRKLIVNLLLKMFPKEVLLRSCVKGFSSTFNLPLDAEKLGALTNFVLAAYPSDELTETDVNRVIHDKLRNLRSAEKLKQRAASGPPFLAYSSASETVAAEQLKESLTTAKEENSQ